MLKISKSELFILLRLIVFNCSILAGFFIYQKFKIAPLKTVVIRLPIECSKTFWVKGKELVNYSCFRNLATAEIKEEN